MMKVCKHTIDYAMAATKLQNFEPTNVITNHTKRAEFVNLPMGILVSPTLYLAHKQLMLCPSVYQKVTRHNQTVKSMTNFYEPINELFRNFVGVVKFLMLNQTIKTSIRTISTAFPSSNFDM